MVTNVHEESEGASRWHVVKHSLLWVAAIFLSTLAVALLSTVVQKASYFLTHAIRW